VTTPNAWRPRMLGDRPFPGAATGPIGPHESRRPMENGPNPRPRGKHPPRAPERGQLDPATSSGLRAARQVTGQSLRAAARRAGIAAGYLSELERGLKRPRAATAEALIAIIPMHPGLIQDLRAAVAPPSAYVSRQDRPPGWQTLPAASRFRP